MKKLVIGILAHVDAGKTTLSEAMLYMSGAIRKMGRVDHKDTFLDTYIQERQRGITIFSKQAVFQYDDVKITLVDTPGHMDFAAEMERTLQILDYAILVVNGREGVQGHTYTLLKLLARYNIPTFIFVNKMDIEGSDKETLLKQLKKHIGEICIDFQEQVYDELALCDEEILNEYLLTGTISDDTITNAIKTRKIIPCYFGSALKLINIEEFMNGISRYTKESDYDDEFGARVYKIARDNKNNRLTYMKITGGKIKVKDAIVAGKTEEKINQIRLYSGSKFETSDIVTAGNVCAVTGLENTFPGQGLGFESSDTIPVLEPVMTYKVVLLDNISITEGYNRLREIGEEDPELNIVWNEISKEIEIQLMGEIQLEVIAELVKERFDMNIAFEQGEVTYKETVEGSSIGIGHFEPLRHYAETHLLMEEGERGSGIVVDANCSEDKLDRNWQRLILSHIEEKIHTGVLINAPLTDIKITLIAGKAHLKHTEGGDFRQATYRALRNGLMKGKPVLLEPWYTLRAEVPQESSGRLIADIDQMSGTAEISEISDDIAVIKGKVSVSEIGSYSRVLVSYTGGRGKLNLIPAGYDKCHNPEEIIAKKGYDCSSDINNTGDSVFCKNGAGFNVPWDKVEEYAHVTDYNIAEEKIITEIKRDVHIAIDDDNLDSIFEKTYGKPKDRTYIHKQVIKPTMAKVNLDKRDVKEEYLLVDGYNIIFAWQELKELAKENIDGAREALIEILANYQGYRKCKIIVVFDAYKVKGNNGRSEKHDNIDVVFTREAETADSYIEKFTYEKASKYYIRVATSDSLEQLIIVGNGAFKVSADEFYKEVKETESKIAEVIARYNRKSYLNSKVTIGDKMKK